MKFATLAVQQRAAIAALCNSGQLNTEQLARVMSGINGHRRYTPPQAATELCALRKSGLIFSYADKGGEQYAKWEVTLVGETLFSHRPDAQLVYITAEDNKLLKQAKEFHKVMKSELKAQPQVTRFVVVPEFEKDPSGTREQALLAAEEAALRTGRVYHVLGLVAEVTPPEQPRAQIKLL